jgi:glycosyltransferase involved in cell wall biosynthesis
LKNGLNISDVLNLEENVGLCSGTNLGVYNAKHDKILIVNDDNVFPLNWDIELLKDYTPNSVISPNQIEPSPSMFKQFHIRDCGRDPKTFSLENYWKYEEPLRGLFADETGSTLPIFMNKYDFIRLGGWDENYELGMVADWDFFLKCSMSNLKMLRTYNSHFYHFASISTNGEKRQQAEQTGHEYAKYKWGSYIYHQPRNKSKVYIYETPPLRTTIFCYSPCNNMVPTKWTIFMDMVSKKYFHFSIIWHPYLIRIYLGNKTYHPIL